MTTPPKTPENMGMVGFEKFVVCLENMIVF